VRCDYSVTPVSKDSAQHCSDIDRPGSDTDRPGSDTDRPRSLDRRADEIQGLDDGEREWIARSGDGTWQSFEYDQTQTEASTQPTDRPVPRPTPTVAVTGVGPDDAAQLATAGITSAERLATINAFAVATALDLDVLFVRSWRHNARELLDR